MNFLRIRVSGYTWEAPTTLISKTFYVKDEAEFGQRVLAWERENNVMEWSKHNQ